VTVARRLAGLEASMTPTQRVVAWLDAAHAFGSLEAYVESLLDQPAEAFPLNRLTREAAIGARAALRGKPTEIVNAAVRKALRETVFRFDLVMRINVTAHETLERESLVQALIASNVALLMNLEKESEPSYLGRLVACRDAAFARVDELLALAEARRVVEARYLDGRAALFPELAERWSRCLHEGQVLAVMAERGVELDGGPLFEPPESDVLASKAAQLGHDLVDPARTTTLEKLDEGRQAIAIATGWVRSKMGSSLPASDADGPPHGPTL
jgi:hypothetical protein